MRIFWGILLLLALSAVACGNEFESDETQSAGAGGSGLPPEECWRDPWSCPDGQGCWLSDNTSVSCYDQGPGELFGECEPFFMEPPCQQDLFCLRLDQNLPGYCTPFCDPQDADRGCPENGRCLQVGVPNTNITFFLCEPPNSPL